MIHRIRIVILAGLLLIAVALLAACQPQEPENPNKEVSAIAEAATDVATNDLVEVAESGGSQFAVHDDSVTTDSNGITIGFTEEGRPFKGDPNAPVLIEEYSDFQCPYCQRFYSQTMGDLIDNQIAGGEAVVVFYDFPLTSIHPQAYAAARAARCASEQGASAFWDMHDQLFETLGQWSVSDPSSAFVSYAQSIGLDAEAFTTCYASDAYSAEVDSDLASGRQRGVTGTPAFFINGQLVSGAQPISVFNQAIAQAASGQPVAAAQPAVETVSAEIQMPTPITFTDQYAYAWGNPDAPVTIVEFTDYQCPFCARHVAQTMPSIMSEMVEQGRVYYIMKDLPLDQLHPEARRAAAAARCAGEQKGYAGMHDLLFETQSEWSGQSNIDELFADYVASLDLDQAAFAECLESGRHEAAVEENVQEAQLHGVTGTPTMFINGYSLFRGAQPYEVFDLLVGYAENGELEDRIREAVAQQNAARQAAQVPPTPVPNADVPTENAFSIGAADAPVTIVEYTDYQCPYCARHFSETLPQIIENYVDAGIVRYVFKDFPLTNIHPQAVAASEAARCAAEQSVDAYIAMHDKLFATQSAWSGRSDVDAVFTGYAAEMGLDDAAFIACLESDKFHDVIQADLQEGAGFGVRGTPAFFINGSYLSGAQPYAVFEQAISAAQAQATQ